MGKHISRAMTKGAFMAYILWLLLPTIQTTLGAVGGVILTTIFGIGVLLDLDFLKKHWKWFLFSVGLVAIIPLLLNRFVGRGGTNLLGYYVQQGMFFLPFLYLGYAYLKKDRYYSSYISEIFIFAIVITTLTTIGWLVQGMTRGDRVYAYSRSLGYAGEGREAYLKELMQRNIGGYGFIYGTVLLLPISFLAVIKKRGFKRTCALIFLVMQLVMIVLSQYTYAIVYACAITEIMIVAILIRSLSKQRIKMGYALIIGVIPLILIGLFCAPILNMLVKLSNAAGFSNVSHSLEQLLFLLSGTVVSEGSRLNYYLVAIQGIKASPLLGSLLNAPPKLSMHSDILDLLSGVGLIGGVMLQMGIYGLSKPAVSLQSVREARCYYIMQIFVVFVIASLGTIVYSNEIGLILAISPLLLKFTSNDW